ncbi:MAG TPA: TetR/AcrR family transcriptional regulator [Mycobacteriales bacterium]|jgi:AcrR family transcriptional regulator|nr:TetR/AcrR family transcriptional regulator [Mycobacteriales bacterium]
MTGQQRRAQLLDVSRALFAERGFEATSIEEIAHRAGVSKPIVYEHFGSKEGIYEVVKDREVQRLIAQITDSLVGDHPRILLEQAATALLTYIETQTDGFRILIRESPVAATTGVFASVIGDIAVQVEYILAGQFKARGYNTRLAPLYSHALVGMVALVGQWWLDARKPSRDDVAAHLVNLAWNGLGNLEPKPALRSRKP